MTIELIQGDFIFGVSFSAKNVRFVHGLLILSIMLDKIIKSNFGVR